MAGSRGAIRHQYGVLEETSTECGYKRWFSVEPMAKRYQVIRDRLPVPGGGFKEAFRMALIEFTCLGERRFDISGYPHESEYGALMSDWSALGADLRVAVKCIETEARDEQQGGVSRVGEAKRSKDAAASRAKSS